MLVSSSIPNLVNGVSQQPPSLRLPTQAQAQENCYPSVVEGLKQRPPTEFVKKLISGAAGACFCHWINRDTIERYVVVIRDESIKVFDRATGTEKTVATPDGTSYLDTTNPNEAFRAVTVADYTFIVNRNKTAAMKADLTANRGPEGLIFVKAGEYGSTYRVFIDGTERATYTTSTTDVATLRTQDIAEDLKSDLAAWGGADWSVSRAGSVIHIKRTNGADFDLTTEDSQGGGSMVSFKDEVQHFSDLPTIAPNGFQLRVMGDPGSETDDYQVKFVTNQGSFAEGVWEETVAQGIKYKIDAATMPHVLVREADGTFTFKKATWDDRTAGDADTAPEPSFIGQKINDLFFYKNRLALLAGQNVILSEVGYYFNFWPTTVTALIDSDPIDTSSSHTKVSVLYHAVPFDKKFVLFSDQTEFILSTGQNTTLTQKTVDLNAVAEFETNLLAKPIAAGKNLYFVVNKDNFNGLREFFMVNEEKGDANDVTGHVPKYIPAGAFKLAASSIEDIIVVATSGDPTALYAYKFYWVENEKRQSAWSRWTFGTGATIRGCEFIETVLDLVVQRSDGLYLERLNVAQGRVDQYHTYVTHLDRRIKDTDCTAITYDSATDRTTFTLPYAADDTMQVVTRQTNPAAALAPGRSLQIVSQSGTSVVVKGDYLTAPLWLGQKYTKSYTFSEQFVREQSPGGGITVVAEGTLTLRDMTIIYDKTGYFKVTVSTGGFRDDSTHLFTGRIVGDANNVLGAVALPSGEFKFPVLSRSDRATITISSDHYMPFHLMSAEWEAFFVKRSRRLS